MENVKNVKNENVENVESAENKAVESTEKNENVVVAKKQTSQKIVNDLIKPLIINYKKFASDKALKIALETCLKNVAVNTAYDHSNGFILKATIKTADFLKFNENIVVAVSKSATQNVNVFKKLYNENIYNLLDKALKIENGLAVKLLFTETYCYMLRKSNKLKDTLKYYNDNNIKITLADLITKTGISVYKTMQQFIVDFALFMNKLADNKKETETK